MTNPIHNAIRWLAFALLLGLLPTAHAQDAFENDGSLALAKSINLDGTIQLRDFHFSGDVDWIKFQLAPGATANLSPRPSASTTSLRWRAELFQVNAGSPQSLAPPYVFGSARPIITVTNTATTTQDYALAVTKDTTPFTGFASRYLLSGQTTGGGPVTNPDAYEANGGNDTRDTGKPLNVADGWQSHNFHVSGDQDWAAFYLGQGLTATVTLDPASPTSDHRWQATLKTVSWNAATGAWELVDAAPTLTVGPQAGSVSGAATISGGQMFWVHTRSISGNFAGNESAYRIRVLTAPTPPSSTPDAFEPNDTRDTAKSLSEAEGWQQHNFHTSSDQDWMAYFLGDGLRSTITVEPITQTPDARWQVTLKTVGRNPTTGQWELVDAAPPATFGAQGVSLSGASVFTGGQMFWVQVLATNGTNFGPASAYRVRVATALNTPYEPNDTRETAGALNVASGWQDHNFHSASDQDWFAYYLGEGFTGTVSIQPVTPTPTAIWQVTLKTVRRNPVTNEWELIDAAPTVSLGPQAGSVSGVATIPGGQMFWAHVRSTDGALSGSASSYRIRSTVTAGTAQSIVITATPSANLVAPATTRLTATVSATSPVQSVEYRYLGSAICAPLTVAPFACDWNQLAAGSYQVTGYATLQTGTLTSVPITLTVAPPAGPTESYVYHHTDARGSIVATTDQNGSIVALPSYRAFGRPVTTSTVQPPVPAPPINGVALGFTGKWYDAQLQLSNHGARHYDPLYSNFISIDPARVREDDSRTVARYMYGNNNPMKFVDPDGRQSIPKTGVPWVDRLTTPSYARANEGQMIQEQLVAEVSRPISLAEAGEMTLIATSLGIGGGPAMGRFAGVSARAAAVSESRAMVLFDGEYATHQLLGTTKTPGGRQIMFHAADRMVNPPPGRAPMTVEQVDEVLDKATNLRKISYHRLGDTLTIQNKSMPGSPEVVVDAKSGSRVITVINPRLKKR